MKIEELYNLSVWAFEEIGNLMDELDDIHLEKYHGDREYVSYVSEYLEYIFHKHPRRKNVAAHDMLCTVLATGYFQDNTPYIDFYMSTFQHILCSYVEIHKLLNKGRRIYTFMMEGTAIYMAPLHVMAGYNYDALCINHSDYLVQRTLPRLSSSKHSFVKRFCTPLNTELNDGRGWEHFFSI